VSVIMVQQITGDPNKLEQFASANQETMQSIMAAAKKSERFFQGPRLNPRHLPNRLLYYDPHIRRGVMPEAYIYDHVRTPRGRGKPDGALHEVTALALATVPLESSERAQQSGGRRCR